MFYVKTDLAAVYTGRRVSDSMSVNPIQNLTYSEPVQATFNAMTKHNLKWHKLFSINHINQVKDKINIWTGKLK